MFDSKHSIFSAKIINRTAFESHVWVIDTGASDHIVCSVSMLTSITSISHCVVKLPNGESAIVTHIGTVQLSAQFTLHNVLCVPSFTFNLLSISKLTKHLPFCLVFLSQFYFIQDLTCWKMIGVGEMHHGLYLLQRKLSSSSSKHPSLSQYLSPLKSILIVNSVVDMPKLWHSRLGHPSFNKLLPIKDVLPSFSQSCDDICTVCPLAKHKRLPFPTHNEISKFPFDLIHIDVWGPYSVITHDGYRYFLTIVDDATRSTWVFILKSKSDVKPILLSFHEMVKTQFNACIKIIISDNAPEFNMLDFFFAHGILHQRSCFCIKGVVLILHKKILLWRKSINIYFQLLEL